MSGNKYNHSIKIIVVGALVVGGSFFAFATFVKSRPAPSSVSNQPDTPIAQIKDYDPIVMVRFTNVCAKLDANNDEFFISGVINSTNGADSLDKIVNASYIVNKKGSIYYCRFGETETINGNGLYVFVDHSLKKIMLGKEKQVVGGSVLPDVSKLIKNLKEEEYNLISTKYGENENISIENDHHITCKQFKLCFKSEDLMPQQIYMRLSNIDHPEEKAMDKIISIDIRKYSTTAETNGVNPDKIVRKNATSWKPAPGYEAYELISI